MIHTNHVTWPVTLLSCVAIMLSSLSARPAPYDHASTIGPAKGWLMIHGGGAVSPDESKEFISLAGARTPISCSFPLRLRTT